MTTMTLINRGHTTIEVHKLGCRDLARDAAGASIWNVNAKTLREIVLDVYPPDDFEYDAADWENYSGDIVVMPCCPPLDGKTRKEGSRYNAEYARKYRATRADRYPILITMT